MDPQEAIDEEADIGEMMAPEDPNGLIVVKQTKEEIMEATVLRRRMRKAQKMFPGLEIFRSVEFQGMQGLSATQLRGLYGDMLLEAKGTAAPQLYAQMYFGASKLFEDTISRFTSVNLTGMTEANVADPEINLCLKLIELEYGIEEQFGVELTPLRTLLIATGRSALMTYKANSEKKPVQHQEEQPTPPPAPAIQPPAVQPPPPPAGSLAPRQSEDFRRAMDLINKMNVSDSKS